MKKTTRKKKPAPKPTPAPVAQPLSCLVAPVTEGDSAPRLQDALNDGRAKAKTGGDRQKQRHTNNYKPPCHVETGLRSETIRCSAGAL
jgi:hypothetical protein